MTLPFVENQTTLPVDELIHTVLNRSEEEDGDDDDESGLIELVVSEMNLDDNGDDLFSISEKYTQYYDETVESISNLLGQPVFNGKMPAAGGWVDKLDIEPEFDKISIWSKDGKHVFLQYIWGDKDMPIIVGLDARS